MTARTRAVLAHRARGLTLDEIAERMHWCRGRVVIAELGLACRQQEDRDPYVADASYYGYIDWGT